MKKVKHSWEKTKNYFEDKCSKCGLIRIKKIGGFPQYLNSEGEIKDSSGECSECLCKKDNSKQLVLFHNLIE